MASLEVESSAQALARIPALLEAIVANEDVAGFMTLIWRGGDIVQLTTIGQRDISAHAPMARDTLFRIASMTKPITSLATLMLMEEGKLALDDPIVKWLPELSAMRVLREPAAPLTDCVPAMREITVEDLLTHRAGLIYSFSGQGELAKSYDQRLGSALDSAMTPDEWLAALGSLPLSYQPGERMHYSHATDVLGFLVARIEGMSLGEVLKRRIFDPLGMVDTGFWVPPEKRNRMAKLYTALPNRGGLREVPMPMPDPPSAFESGGGGLISTMDDYLRFARMMLGRGELEGVRLVKPETMDLMTSNQLTPEQRQFTFIGLPYWESMGFGLGVSVIMDPAKHAAMGAGSAGTFGWPGAYGTWWQADPEKGVILMYLVQDAVQLSAETVTGSRQMSPSRAALIDFQKLAYEALG